MEREDKYLIGIYEVHVDWFALGGNLQALTFCLLISFIFVRKEVNSHLNIPINYPRKFFTEQPEVCKAFSSITSKIKRFSKSRTRNFLHHINISYGCQICRSFSPRNRLCNVTTTSWNNQQFLTCFVGKNCVGRLSIADEEAKRTENYFRIWLLFNGKVKRKLTSLLM